MKNNNKYVIPQKKNIKGDIEFLYEKASNFYELGQYETAIEYCKEILKSSENNIYCLYLLGLSFFKLTNYIQSVYFFEKILKIDSNYTLAINNLMIIYLDYLKNYDKSIEYSLKLYSFDHKNTEALSNIGLSYLKKKNYNEAITHFKKVLEMKPNNVIALTNLSVSYIELKENFKAIEICEKILKIDKNNENALINLSTAYFNIKDYNSSVNCCLKVLTFNDLTEDALVNISLSFIELKKFEEVLKFLGKLLLIDSKMPIALYLLGKTYLSLDNLVKSLDYFNKIILNNVTEKKILFENQLVINSIINKAFILYELKRYEEAKETIKNTWFYLEEYKEGSNINTFSEYYYTYSLIIHEENLDEAIEYINKAIKYDNSRYDFYMQTAFYYYLKNDKELFYENMNKSIELKKTNKDEQFKVSFVDGKPIIEKTYKKVKIPEDIFFEMINEINERKAKEQEIRLQERNKVIADLSHSIKNLIGGSIMASLENLKKEIGDSLLIRKALKGSELIKRIVTAMNLSFSGSIDDFVFDAKNSNESTTLKTLIIESLKYSTENMFDNQYFSQFKEQYFPTREVYINSKKTWDEVIKSNDLNNIQNFLNENMIKFEYDFDDSATYSISDEKGSATKLMILFQEIIFNAVKYSSFVVKNDRKLIISLKKDNGNIIFDVKNSCLIDLVEKSTGLGKEIIANFTKLLQTQPIVTKENNLYDVKIVFKNFWEQT